MCVCECEFVEVVCRALRTGIGDIMLQRILCTYYDAACFNGDKICSDQIKKKRFNTMHGNKIHYTIGFYF